jgi:hypothetical protein
MQSFEDVRSHLVNQYTLKDNAPYIISFEVSLEDGRSQSMFLAELDSEKGRKYLRISTPVAPISKRDATKCLRFNWEQRVGYLALSDIDGEAYLHLCENRTFSGLGTHELDSVICELASLADSLEQAMRKGKDVS